MIRFPRMLLALVLLAISSTLIRGQQLLTSPSPNHDDRLSPPEEEHAYGTMNPSARVAAFLKIADRKIENARRLQKANPDTPLAEALKGYLAAVEGAIRGVSWGKDRGEDMRRQSDSVARTIGRHARELRRLGSTVETPDRPFLLQLRQALLARHPQRMQQEPAWESGRLSPAGRCPDQAACE